ncbi:hypothetical protein, partial [Streptomyces sp. SM14]|uniref:hypothetical protein n=1 Tax=Streptomyces sp. SM14 TaxID=1736045 RepID=UPI0011B035BE
MLETFRSLPGRANRLTEVVRTPPDPRVLTALPVTLGSGLAVLARSAGTRCRRTPPERRLPLAALVVTGLVLLWLLPGGLP